MKNGISAIKREINEIWSTILKCCKEVSQFLKMAYKSISKWIGIDGLLNLESCIVLVCFFGMFLDELAAGLIVMIVSVIKSSYDKYKCHHKDEMHDFICCMIGILIGIILVAYQL